MKCILAALAILSLAAPAQALSLDDLSGKDAAGGLRQALTQGAGKAVSELGRTDGFLGNPKVRIPLPENLRKIEGLIRKLGMSRQVDDLETAMNRAAESAVPESKALLVNAIRQMSIKDAKAILTGGDDAATQYFRRTTAGPLAEKFRPVVRKAMAKVRLAEKYDEFAAKGVKLGLVREDDASLENYVTARTLDGLYLMIAEEERAIRKDPVSAAGSLAKRVFGALR